MTIKPNSKLTEKIAIVTGASKGIDRLRYNLVKGLCQKYGGIVYLTASDENRGLEAVRKLNELGLKAIFHQLDVSDKNSVEKFANFVKSKHGYFDILVNNAAILEWGQVYPSYEAAKKNIDINYKSLLTIENYLYPLLRDGARVVNTSIAFYLSNSEEIHLSNQENKKKWIETLMDSDLTTEKINEFVNEYLESVKNGTFNKNDFADGGEHAEHRVSKIVLTALTKVQQRKYKDRNISIRTTLAYRKIIKQNK